MNIKKIINFRHFFYAWWGSIKYHRPSDELLVIGITGTTGKSSVIHFLRQVLEFAGFKVGSLSTVDFCINGKCELNNKKMTMVGKMFIQEKLREMVNKKCDIAIVETTSEGFLQYRHKFIDYDVILLTNLYPEHIESHGGFENYKAAKLGIFEYVSNCKKKVLNNPKFKLLENKCCNEIVKSALVNGNSEYAEEFLNFGFENKLKFEAKNIEVTKEGLNFQVEIDSFFAPIYGGHNAENLAAVIAVAKCLGITESIIKQSISKVIAPPGRIEFIPEAEKFGFQVIVDYAFEPVALAGLYQVVKLLNSKRVIHVCGSTGGGRDKARREPIGKLVGEKADIFIITDEDPYDEDPKEIMEQVKVGALQAGKIENENLFMILDRREAIKKAIDLVGAGDLILITGKGSEQKMCVAGGKMVPWDDREIVKEYLISNF